jgi:3-deoxy-D-manno-octulosonate 8-phosphate phosphatase KdsC-like HAD superfamily phosphatase
VQGLSDKGEALREWAAARGIRLDRIAYLGNDRGDIPALDLVGWPMAVPDATPDVLERARHVLQRHGGHGAVRELADLVLAARTAQEFAPERHEGGPARPTRLQREALAAASGAR